MDIFIMSLRTGEKQSFGTDQLLTQIGVLLALLTACSSQSLHKIHLKSQCQLLLILESLEFFIWVFFTFLLRPLKNGSLDTAGMETHN